MRNITIKEVHVGCLACDIDKSTMNDPSAFLCGVLAGLLRDNLPLCKGHYGGFRRAMAKVEAEDPGGWERKSVAAPLPGEGEGR
jgi:hypothetical protein